MHRLRLSAWTILSLFVAILIAAPAAMLGLQMLRPSDDIWTHLASTVLGIYVGNTLLLMAAVGALATIIGAGCAWLVTMTRWPGSRWLEWALLLPLAFPAYVLAYVYLDLFQPGGRLGVWLAAVGLPQDWAFSLPVAGLPGAILLMTAAFYPYVYLLARAAFLEQSVCVLDVSRTLGCGPWRQFFRVALPLARPGIAAGAALVMMETASEFGLVQHLGVPTFTTGIFRTWFGLGSPVGAAQLSSLLLAFVLALLLIEHASRGEARFHATTERRQPLTPTPLTGMAAASALGFCLLPLFVGFILPAAALIALSIGQTDMRLLAGFGHYAGNSLRLAALAAMACVALALLLGYARRLDPSPAVRAFSRFATLGYAVPGSVIAVGILTFLGAGDGAIRAFLGEATPLVLLGGSVLAMIYAYVVRFLAVAFNGVEAGLQKIRPSLDDAARSLGAGPRRTLWRVHAPLMKSSLLAAAILVFVDVLKELPATLIVRPFNMDTLAVRVYQLASDERLAEASGAALAILLVGLIPVLMLSVMIRRSRPITHGEARRKALEESPT